MNPTLIESYLTMFSFLKNRTTASILSSFASTLAELEDHAKVREAASLEARERAHELHAEADAHDEEVRASKSVASKLRALIG